MDPNKKTQLEEDVDGLFDPTAATEEDEDDEKDEKEEKC